MIILFCVYFALRVFADVMKKKVTNSFSVGGVSGSLFFVLETSIFAMLVFFVLNGFKLYINPLVTFYGFLYGVLVIFSTVSSVFVYNFATIAFVGFVSSCFNLLASQIIGAALFGEAVTLPNLLRVALMILAALVSFIGAGGFKIAVAQSVKRFTYALILTLTLGMVGTLGTILMKYYTADTGVTDSNSFFFMTNVFSALLVIPLIPIAAKRDGVKLSSLLEFAKGRRILYTMLTTANNNIISVVTILLLSMIDVSVFTPLSNTLAFISIAVATPLIREKLDKYTVIATSLAVASVVFPELIALV